MIIATAGHVDHGKTSLVRALTGVDTDRLEEEKRRGLSIDIGFAYTECGASEPLGFVDVPGHERFVRNMLAGVASIDLALLVIAADDGPMPQTREHLAILQMLGVAQAVVALTKIDRVSTERAQQAAVEVADLLAPGPYAAAPVFALDTLGGHGVSSLREHLALLARALPARAQGGHFRLAVDRSFSLAGAGRIVTGAVLSGRVAVGEELVLSPAGARLRVRAIHAQGRPAQQASAGQRCALNLAGVALKQAEPERGDWLLAAAAHAPSTRIDVMLSVLASESRPLIDGTTLQLHVGAAALPVRVAVLGAAQIAAGQQGLAQLQLATPVAVLHRDRFMLRDLAAQRSVGGGWVIDPFAPARGRSKPARLVQLGALALPDAMAALQALLQREPTGVDVARFLLTRNITTAEAAPLLQPLPLRWVDAQHPSLALLQTHWDAWGQRLLATLAQWHADQPASLGLTAAALHQGLRQPGAGTAVVAGAALVPGAAAGPGAHSQAEPNLPVKLAGTPSATVLRALLDALVADGHAAREGLRWRLAAHVPRLAQADSALLGRVITLLQPCGLRPPIVGELATQLGVPLPETMDFLHRASALGQLSCVAPNRFYLPATVAELAALAAQLAQAGGGQFDAAAYRDASGIGRNLTVQVLEFLDREGVTRFDGRARRLAC